MATRDARGRFTKADSAETRPKFQFDPTQTRTDVLTSAGADPISQNLGPSVQVKPRFRRWSWRKRR